MGGVIGGLYADVTDPTTFTVIFLADGVSMLVPIVLLLGPLRHVHGRWPTKPADADAGAGLLPRDPAPAGRHLADRC